jgi:hypothetical protein
MGKILHLTSCTFLKRLDQEIFDLAFENIPAPAEVDLRKPSDGGNLVPQSFGDLL